MLKLVCFLHRKAELDPTEFHGHWRDRHGPLIADRPTLAQHVVRYEQNPRLNSDYERDGSSEIDEFDGATIMWFESLAAYHAYAMDPVYEAEIAPDEARFLDRARTTWFLSHEAERKIGDAASEARAEVKLLALLKRRSDLSAEAFHAHWSGPHGDLFRNTPALADTILAYQQNHRAELDYERDPEFPFDGMAEQWYASLDAFYAGAGGAPFTEVVVPDEERFMDRAATRFILCEPPRVVLGGA